MPTPCSPEAHSALASSPTTVINTPSGREYRTPISAGKAGSAPESNHQSFGLMFKKALTRAQSTRTLTDKNTIQSTESATIQFNILGFLDTFAPAEKAQGKGEAKSGGTPVNACLLHWGKRTVETLHDSGTKPIDIGSRVSQYIMNNGGTCADAVLTVMAGSQFSKMSINKQDVALTIGQAALTAGMTKDDISGIVQHIASNDSDKVLSQLSIMNTGKDIL